MNEKSNLLTRTLTALIFLPVTFVFIFSDYPWIIIPLYLFGVVLMSLEIHNLILPNQSAEEGDRFNRRISYGFILSVAFLNSYILIYRQENFLHWETVVLVGMLVEFLILSLSYIFFSRNFTHSFRNQLVYLFIFFYLNFIFFHILKLKYFFAGKGELQNLAGFYLFFCFSICWLFDSSAYLFGRKWGKKKIGLKVSPQKSWMGLIAGLLSTLLAGAIVSAILKAIHPDLWEKSFFSETYLPWLIFLVLGLVAQWGDLIASLHKRSSGVKDTGSILKGHGGFYDRHDSVILVSVVLYYFLFYYYH